MEYHKRNAALEKKGHATVDGIAGNGEKPIG